MILRHANALRSLRAFSLDGAPALQRQTPLALLVALTAFLFFFHLGTRDLVSSHEARAAQNAQRMLDTGAWGLPTLFDSQPDLQKPPGFYWLIAVAGWVSGGHVSPFVARFPAALAALASVLLVYGFLRREGSRIAAVVATTTLASANHFIAIGRTARIDVPLTCAVTLSLLSFYRACAPCDSRPRTALYLLSALAAAVAVLLKGPVALALIGPVAVAFLVAERFASPVSDRPRLPTGQAFLGATVVAVVAVPWFVWANHATRGEFFRVFFWHHNVERFTGGSESLASHPWWYYGPRFAMAFLPGTLTLVPLVVWGFRSGLWRESRVFRFGMVWLGVMVAVLSTAHFKRADYLLPAFPGATIAMGCAAQSWLASRTNPRTVTRAKWAFELLIVCGLAVCPVMWFAVEPAEAARQEKRPFAAAIRAQAPAPESVLLFRTESHLLAYHLGPPLHTLVEWGELKERLSAPGPHTVVMPPEYAADAGRITGRRLVPVAALTDYLSVRPHRPLVCLRTAE